MIGLGSVLIIRGHASRSFCPAQVLSEILWDTAQPPQYYQQQFLQQAQGTPQVHVQPAQGYPMPPPYATAGYAGATAWFHAGPTNPI